MSEPLPRAAASDAEALDAYSLAVVAVAERVVPSVVSLRHAAGSGSAVALSSDGLLVTSAHVIARGRTGTAIFRDGAELPYEVVGRDRLSELAVVRVPGADLPGPSSATPHGPGSVSSSSRSEARSASRARCRRAWCRRWVGRCRRSTVGECGSSRASSRPTPPSILGTAAVRPRRVTLGSWASTRRRRARSRAGPRFGRAAGRDDDGHHRGVGHQRSCRQERAGTVGWRARPSPRAADRLGRRCGVEVASVVTGGPAARAGIRPEDIVVALGGQPVEAVNDIQRVLTGDCAGRAMEAQVVRGGEVLAVTVVLRVL